MTNARESLERSELEQADEAVRLARRQIAQEVSGVQRLTSQVGVVPSAPWVRLLAAAAAGAGAAFALKGLLGRR